VVPARPSMPTEPASQAGLSSATTDGGRNWQDANDIGRFINRFRFFGDPGRGRLRLGAHGLPVLRLFSPFRRTEHTIY
jgi:hypothetical protein